MKDEIPSKTALIVAVILIMAGSADPKLVPPNAVQVQVELLKHTTVASRFPFWLLTNAYFCKFIVWISGLLVVSRFMQGMGFRKLFMESKVRLFLNSHKNKAAQVLVIAGGYDTLAIRLCQEFLQVSFWELDHPATCQQKASALAKMYASAGKRDNLHLVPVDLTQTTLQEALLKSTCFDPSRPTIAILEGLLFYLEEDHVRQLFESLSQVVPRSSSSQAAFDHFSLDQNGYYNNGWISSIQSAIVSKMGETWHWAIRPCDLTAFFADTPWKITEQAARAGLEHCVLVSLSK